MRDHVAINVPNVLRKWVIATHDWPGHASVAFRRVDEELEPLLGVDDVVDLDERAVVHGALVDLDDLVADVQDARQEFLGTLVHKARHELACKGNNRQTGMIAIAFKKTNQNTQYSQETSGITLVRF